MSRGLTLRDLLFWATIELKGAADDRARAIWAQVVRRIEECAKTYERKAAPHGPRRNDVARHE